MIDQSQSEECKAECRADSAFLLGTRGYGVHFHPKDKQEASKLYPANAAAKI